MAHIGVLCKGLVEDGKGETGLGYLGWLMMRTKPFCVRAQDAQPCWISPEIHSWARSWSTWSASSSARSTLMSRSARITRGLPLGACQSTRWKPLPRGGAEGRNHRGSSASWLQDPPDTDGWASRASSDRRSPALRFCRRALSLTAIRTSSAMSRVVRMHQMLAQLVGAAALPTESGDL